MIDANRAPLLAPCTHGPHPALCETRRATLDETSWITAVAGGLGNRQGVLQAVGEHLVFSLPVMHGALK